MKPQLRGVGMTCGIPFLRVSCWTQRVEDLLEMQMALLHLKPVSGTQDGWEWGGTFFSVLRVCKEIRDGWNEEIL